MTIAQPRVLFVSGFHRSGTTLVASAATDATGGRTLTVGDLARRIPSLAAFLAEPRDTPADRGVDRLPVTTDTPEEYGWLLYRASGRHALREDDVRDGVLPDLVRDIGSGEIGAGDVGSGEIGAGDVGPPATVVLKNPWDTGREDLMLRAFPDGGVLLVRRGLAAIEDSSRRSLERLVSSDAYLRALMDDDRNVRTLLGALAQPGWRRLILFYSRWRLRFDVLRLAARAGRLPADRVAYLSYEELSRDPEAGAAWAAHLLVPADLARAFAARAFADAGGARAGGWVTRALDAWWARSWRRARAAQVAAGVVARFDVA